MSLDLAYLTSLAILAIFAFLLQGFFKPDLCFKNLRRASEVFVLLLLGLASFHALLTIATQRPFFSSSICIILLLVIRAVSNAKYTALREPLVFTDFYLYFQAFKHPRLYLPFLGLMPILFLVVVGGLVVTTGLSLESARFNIVSWWAVFLSFLSVSMCLLVICFSWRLEISEDISKDSKSYGVLATLILYATQSTSSHKKIQHCITKLSPFGSEEECAQSENQADIIVIQSESFFDARFVTPNIRKDVLIEYDRLLLNSSVSGRLKVPAWGANTMRSEFAFLTGINPKMLGLAQYYPYQQLLRYKMPSLLSCLKEQGYYCVCIHPHAASFFKRDEFFSKLGFDEFIDEGSFKNAERYGPYVADAAVTAKIKEVCEQSDKPYFIFGITMENHGPLHLEDVATEEGKEYFYEEPEEDLNELTVYLRHLKNADKMILELSTYLLSRNKDALLGFYGDHVPAISKVFEKLNYQSPHSDYFIWSTWERDLARKKIKESSELAVENLAIELISILNTRNKF